MNDYQSCPNCNGAILTTDYEQRYGQCMSCYSRENMTLGQRINRSL